jgi:hypothetical protein
VAVTDWLIDKSALVRMGDSPDADEWATRIERGLVRITTVPPVARFTYPLQISASAAGDLATGDEQQQLE